MWEIWDGRKISRGSVTHGRILAVCGIGNSRLFLNDLAEWGVPVVDHIGLSDHAGYDQPLLDHLVEVARAARADRIVTTEKDAVKLAVLGKPDFPFCYVKIAAAVREEEQFFQFLKPYLPQLR